MPAVVQKSTTATNNIVCVSQACNVADDGLITVRARFLLRTASDTSFFELDSQWPSGSSPRGLPRNQGGPYLLSRDFEYGAGLVFVNATYVTAANPVRVVYSEQKATRGFSGVVAIINPEDNTFETTNARFDYRTTVAVARYTLLDKQVYTPDLSAAKINDIIGVAQSVLDLIGKKSVDSEERSTLGRVTQVSKSREIVFYSL